MGYSTFFCGRFELVPALTPSQVATIGELYNHRHSLASSRDDEPLLRLPYEAPLMGNMSELAPVGRSPSHATYTGCEKGMAWSGPFPSAYCQWTVTSDGSYLEWDGGEKFYGYELWLRFLIEHFFKPWNVAVTGAIEFEGEDGVERGTIFAHGDRVLVILAGFGDGRGKEREIMTRLANGAYSPSVYRTV